MAKHTGKLIRALYAGSFDPPSVGHLDIIQRATSSLCHHLIVGVAINPNKNSMFSIEERERLVQKMTHPLQASIEVTSFDGLVVDFAKDNDGALPGPNRRSRGQLTPVIQSLCSYEGSAPTPTWSTSFEWPWCGNVALPAPTPAHTARPAVPQINRRLSGIETAFLMADSKTEHISSSLIREVRPRPRVMDLRVLTRARSPERSLPTSRRLCPTLCPTPSPPTSTRGLAPPSRPWTTPAPQPARPDRIPVDGGLPQGVPARHSSLWRVGGR